MNHSKVNKGLNKYLRAQRLKSGNSQGDMSKALGYGSPQFISNMERSLVRPSQEMVRAYIEMCGANSDKVFSFHMLHENQQFKRSLMGEVKYDHD